VNSSQRNQADSPLLRMPGELRNTINDYILDHQIVTLTTTGETTFMAADVQNALNLTQVCRQTYAETAKLVLSACTFKFNNSATFATWLARLPDHQRDAISRIEMQGARIIADFGGRDLSIILKTPEINTLSKLTGLKYNLMAFSVYPVTEKEMALVQGLTMVKMDRITKILVEEVKMHVVSGVEVATGYTKENSCARGPHILQTGFRSGMNAFNRDSYFLKSVL
jgi:hypothetical protein